MFDSNFRNKIIDLIDSGATPGCALTILNQNHTVLDFSYGFFYSNENEVSSSRTLYDLASITKIYVTALVLRLHEAGQLDIYKKCSSYLDIFNHSEIKIIDLMTHRVNFGVRLSEYRSQYGDRFRQEVFSISPPQFVSESVEYENLTFIYLGKIIEEVTSQSLETNFRSLFSALNLNQTKLSIDLDQPTPPTEIVNGEFVQNLAHDESARLMGGVAGNAGIFASSNDMAKFGQAWLTEDIVSYDLLHQYVFKDYDETGKKPQGLGWWLRVPSLSLYTPTIYSHTGYTGCLLAIDIASKVVCAFVCNRTVFGRENNKHREIWKTLLFAMLDMK